MVRESVTVHVDVGQLLPCSCSREISVLEHAS